MIEMTYCGDPYHDQLGYVVDCGKDDGPCRGCLRAHIARLEAALKEAEGARVVPEQDLTRVDIAVIWHEVGLVCHGDQDVRTYGERVANLGYKLGLHRAQVTPASRVLKDGEVAVDPAYLSALVLVRGILFDHMAEESGIPVTDALAGAMELIGEYEANIRAQPTEERKGWGLSTSSPSTT